MRFAIFSSKTIIVFMTYISDFCHILILHTYRCLKFKHYSFNSTFSFITDKSFFFLFILKEFKFLTLYLKQNYNKNNESICTNLCGLQDLFNISRSSELFGDASIYNSVRTIIYRSSIHQRRVIL